MISHQDLASLIQLLHNNRIKDTDHDTDYVKAVSPSPPHIVRCSISASTTLHWESCYHSQLIVCFSVPEAGEGALARSRVTIDI